MPQNENKPANENKPVQKKRVGTNNSNNKKNTASNNKPSRRPKTDKPRTDKSRSDKPKTRTQKTENPKTSRTKPDRARAEKQKTNNKNTEPKKKFKKPPFNKNKDKNQNKKNGDDFSILSRPVETKAWTIEEADRYITAVKNAFDKIPESEDKIVDLRDIWINSSLPGDLILEIIRENYEKIGIEKENLLLDGKKILLINEQPDPVNKPKKDEKTLNT